MYRLWRLALCACFVALVTISPLLLAGKPAISTFDVVSRRNSFPVAAKAEQRKFSTREQIIASGSRFRVAPGYREMGNRACLRSEESALITGVSGMIGSYVAKQLIAEGKYEVHGLIRYRSDLVNLAGELHNIKLIHGDVLDGARMRSVVASICPKIIFHFAAQAINGVSYDSAELTLDTNIKGTFNMLEAVRSAGLGPTTRFLLAGSSTEYGRTADTWNGAIPEIAPMAPVSPYGVSKAAADLLAQQYVHSHGMQVITARFFIQVASGGTESLAPQEFCRQIAMIERGLQDPIVKHGKISTRRDITDLRDSASVITKLAELGEAGEVYNIGSGIALSIEDILSTAISLSLRKDIKTVLDVSRERLYDEKVLLSDNSKVRKITGWVPNPNITDTVHDILQYWRRKVSMLYPLASKAGHHRNSLLPQQQDLNLVNTVPVVACDHQNFKMRALITGVSGMIGSYVAKQLIAEGKYEVHGLIRYRSDLVNLAGELHNIKLIHGDVLDGARMRSVVASICPKIIFHFAAQAINGVSYDSAELTLDTNIKGTFNMLEAVRSAGLGPTTRFLLAGSSTEYGRTADTWNGAIPEIAPMAPVSPYGVSKAAADLLAQQYVHSHGMQVITARFFIQVASGGTESLAPQEFCRQIAMIERGLQDPIVKHGKISTRRDITDLRDSASVITKLAELGEAGEVYNIGSGIALSIEDILSTAISLSLRKDIKTVLDVSRERLYDEKVLLSDNSKVRKITGWVPNPNITDTVHDILQYWRRKVSMLYPPAVIS